MLARRVKNANFEKNFEKAIDKPFLLCYYM